MTRADDTGTGGGSPPPADGASPTERPSRANGASGPGASPGVGSARARVPAGRLEHVIRRAAELQHSAGEAGPETLSGEEIVRIGREVGLEPRHVRQALAEHRAESLLPDLPRDDTPARVLGPAVVRGSRAVPGDRGPVQEKVEEHLRTRESLQAVRQRPGRSLWEPAGSLLSKMQRAVDVGGRGYELAEARSVELSVSQLEDGWSLVAFTVDARNLRSQHAVNWLAGSAPFWFAGALGLELLAGVPWLVTGPLAGAGLLGTAAGGGGWSFAKKRKRLELVVSGLLDRLEQGVELEPDRPPGWRERLLSGHRGA